MVNTKDKELMPVGYKQTEVGIIPVDWNALPLSELTTLMTNGFVGTAKTHYTDSSDGVLYIQGYNVEENSFNFRGIKRVTQEFHQHQSKSCLREGDVLMVQTGDVGLTTVVPKELAGANCHALIISRFKAQRFNSLYFSYFLNSVDGRNKLKDLEVGTTMKHINVGDLLNFIVPVPPKLEEQTAIANSLSDVDDLIAALEKLINKKSAIKTAAMQQLLTGKKRLPPFDQLNTGYKQTELGEIPGDWEVSTLDGVSSQTMQNGLFYEPSRKGKGVHLINVGDMYKSAPINVSELELFDATSAEKKTFRVISGDLFFTRSSIVPSGIAYCNICEDDADNYEVVFDSHLIRLRADSRVTNSRYLYLACMASYARKFLIGSAKTATMTTIDQGALKKCPILLPSIAEQTAIANVLSDMDKDLEAQQQRLHKTQQIKQGMMQELLTGKTRLVKPQGDAIA